MVIVKGHFHRQNRVFRKYFKNSKEEIYERSKFSQ